MIASSTSASTGTGGFYASFAMPAPEPPYSHNCAGYYSSRGLGKTMVLSAFIVVLLIGASYHIASLSATNGHWTSWTRGSAST